MPTTTTSKPSSAAGDWDDNPNLNLNLNPDALFTPCAMNRKSEADASLFRFSPLHYGRGRGEGLLGVGFSTPFRFLGRRGRALLRRFLVPLFLFLAHAGSVVQPLVAALCQYLRALQEHAPHGSLCGYKYPKSFASASVFHQKNKESGRRCYVSFRLQRYKKFVNYKPFAY